MLTVTPNPLLHTTEPSGATVAVIEQQLAKRPHLKGDRRILCRERKLDLRDARQAKSAAEALGELPGPDEGIHMVISGRFALWDFVPGIAATCNIETLHIATLGFSTRNIARLCELHDAGAIGEARLLCSHYFKGTSAAIYEFAEQEFAKRPRLRFLSLRSHCKLLLLRLDDGRRLTIHGSPNLRSSKNIEQVSAHGSPVVHDFYARMIDDLFREAGL